MALSEHTALIRRIERQAERVAAAEHALRVTIREARWNAPDHDTSLTWAEIADALGVSKQAAWEKYSQDPLWQ